VNFLFKKYPLIILSVFLILCSAVDSVSGATHFADLTSKRYKQAAAYYNNLLVHPLRAEKRANWLRAAKNFQKISREAGHHTRTPDSLFMAGKIYRQLGERFGRKDDFDQAVNFYQKLVQNYPDHRLADDALLAMGRIMLDNLDSPARAAAAFARIVTLFPDGDMQRVAARLLKNYKIKSSGPGKTIATKALRTKKDNRAIIRQIRHWSTKDYTRVVVETSKPVKFAENVLSSGDNRNGRHYINLFSCRVDQQHKDPIIIRDGLLKQVRSAQFSPRTARVVLDTQSLASYKVFSLTDPFRVVIDLLGIKKAPARLPTLAEQLGLEVRRVVIDPGHGGKDPGAIGFSGLREKDVVLKVAKKVAARLAAKGGYEVILTRNRDKFIPLEERTAIANSRQADLFVSIHANSAPNRKAHGVETYFLSLASSKGEMRAAARENAASSRQLSDLQAILKDLMQNSKIEESSRLAGAVQEQLFTGLHNYHVPNLGVKKAPFVVLIGARMPAILAEIGFISNALEEKNLRKDSYLSAVAEQIVKGIMRYSRQGLAIR
jgi:N-acetylmuramoyl-L-alanine amidase